MDFLHRADSGPRTLDVSQGDKNGEHDFRWVDRWIKNGSPRQAMPGETRGDTMDASFWLLNAQVRATLRVGFPLSRMSDTGNPTPPTPTRSF